MGIEPESDESSTSRERGSRSPRERSGSRSDSRSSSVDREKERDRNRDDRRERDRNRGRDRRDRDRDDRRDRDRRDRDRDDRRDRDRRDERDRRDRRDRSPPSRKRSLSRSPSPYVTSNFFFPCCPSNTDLPFLFFCSLAHGVYAQRTQPNERQILQNCVRFMVLLKVLLPQVPAFSNRVTLLPSRILSKLVSERIKTQFNAGWWDVMAVGRRPSTNNKLCQLAWM